MAWGVTCITIQAFAKDLYGNILDLNILVALCFSEYESKFKPDRLQGQREEPVVHVLHQVSNQRYQHWLHVHWRPHGQPLWPFPEHLENVINAWGISMCKNLFKLASKGQIHMSLLAHMEHHFCTTFVCKIAHRPTLECYATPWRLKRESRSF